MRELMGYLPEWYRESPETVLIQQAIQPELQQLWDRREDLLLQLDPWTATWGLTLWEAALGMETEEAPLEQRRAAVAARLRGRETTTPALLKSVSETVLGVPVTVTEHYAAYRVEVCFDAQGTLPAGLDALERQLDQIMPAHLAWDFLITMTSALHVGGHFTSYNVTTLPMLAAEEGV